MEDLFEHAVLLHRIRLGAQCGRIGPMAGKSSERGQHIRCREIDLVGGDGRRVG